MSDERDEYGESTLHGQPVPWMRELPKPSRRRFVLGVAGVGVVAAAAGAATGWLTEPTSTSAAGTHEPEVSDQLLAAHEAEQQLILIITAAVGHATGAKKQALKAILADHRAHLAALKAAVGPAASSSASASPSPGKPSPTEPAGIVTSGIARIVEQRASRVAAARAFALTGRDAALLASISASEAMHAELLASVVK
jgi:hypothetical protein